MNKKFNKNKYYRNLCLIFSPHGIILENTKLTGKQWENILSYDVGNSFEEMFEEL